MTNIYFVRHAESDNNVHDDMNRPLTKKGFNDRSLVFDYFKNIEVSAVFSSPYKRAYDTVAELAAKKGLDVVCIDAFKERRIDGWIEDFWAYSKRQWDDFDYKILSGESLRETQSRNIEALHELLSSRCDETIVVGTHGTALSTIINYFDNTFSYERFAKIVGSMPWIVHFVFDGDKCLSVNPINPFDF